MGSDPTDNIERLAKQKGISKFILNSYSGLVAKAYNDVAALT